MSRGRGRMNRVSGRLLCHHTLTHGRPCPRFLASMSLVGSVRKDTCAVHYVVILSPGRWEPARSRHPEMTGLQPQHTTSGGSCRHTPGENIENEARGRNKEEIAQETYLLRVPWPPGHHPYSIRGPAVVRDLQVRLASVINSVATEASLTRNARACLTWGPGQEERNRKKGGRGAPT